MTDWGPHNPHPLSRMKTELVWEGKYDEYGNRRSVCLPASPLPLQRKASSTAPSMSTTWGATNVSGGNWSA